MRQTDQHVRHDKHAEAGYELVAALQVSRTSPSQNKKSNTHTKIPNCYSSSPTYLVCISRGRNQYELPQNIHIANTPHPKTQCHEDGADCWYATDRTVSGVRWPPSTDMVSCSNNNMPQGDRRPLHFPDPESFRPYFKPLENFPDL